MMCRSRISVSVLLMFVLGSLFSAPGFAQGLDLSVTEIIGADGRVEVKKGPEPVFQRLNRNLRLAGALKRLDGGDKVRTYEKSFAEMSLKDTCILAVKEESIFEVPVTIGAESVDELVAQQGSVLFKVVSGSDFQVRTADLIAGVKGTLFEVEIVDSFKSMLEVPGLQIGYMVPGGTMINVYSGEVELTHQATGQSRTLTAGQSIAAVGAELMKMSDALSQGFGQLKTFLPESVLRSKYGAQAASLLNVAPSVQGLSAFSGLGAINSARATPLETLQTMVDGTGQAGEIIDQIKQFERLGRDLIGEKYRHDFSSYRKQTSRLSLNDRSFREAYLGDQTFAAARAISGRANLEPVAESLQLVEGDGMTRVRKYGNDLPVIDFLVSHRATDNSYNTEIQVVKGDIYGRVPGELKVFQIPAGAMAFRVDRQTGRSELVQSNNGAIDNELKEHIFEVERKIAREKGAHDQKTQKRQVDAVKDVLKNKPGKLLNRIRLR